MSTSDITSPTTLHPLVVRVTHWINALAMLMMITSGWRIYNASPIFDFVFPRGITLGGWLGGALQWHFAAMWLLVLNGLTYFTYSIVSGHWRMSLLPLSPRAVWNDMRAALTFKLEHHQGTYNAVQKLLYLGVLVLGVLVVLSGLAIWKPVLSQHRLDGHLQALSGFSVDMTSPASSTSPACQASLLSSSSTSRSSSSCPRPSCR